MLFLICVKGNLYFFYIENIVIVGFWNVLVVGCKFVKGFVSDLGEVGFIVVFGMVCGIDGLVYVGVFLIGIVVVLVGGIDYIYLFDY